MASAMDMRLDFRIIEVLVLFVFSACTSTTLLEASLNTITSLSELSKESRLRWLELACETVSFDLVTERPI